MPRKAEKETRYDEDDEKEKKKARYESRPSRPEDGEMVPKELLSVPVSQETWNVLGKDSRVRVLSEQPTNESCFFCQQKGHRAFYCSSMLACWCSVLDCPATGDKRSLEDETERRICFVPWPMAIFTIATQEPQNAIAQKMERAGATIRERHARGGAAAR